jgi:hypothetical protein
MLLCTDVSQRGIHRRTSFELTGDVINRFHENVAKADGDGCWLWTGCDRGNGYGCLKVQGKLVSAHRVAFVIGHGRQPDGLVCHACDNPRCVRPSHLFDGSPLDNVRDMEAKGRSSRTRGERQWNAVLTTELVRAIREKSANGMSHRAIAKELGVGKSTVSCAAGRKSWKHVTP